MSLCLTQIFSGVVIMDHFLKQLNRITDSIFSFQKWFLLLLVSLMTIINVAQVIGRYVFHFSIPWSEQVSVILFIYIIMIGANIAVKTDTEIKIAILNFKDRKKQAILGIIIDIFSIGAVIFFMISAIGLVMHSLHFKQVVSSIQLNYVFVFLILPIGFLLIVMDKFVNLLRKIVFVLDHGKGGR